MRNTLLMLALAAPLFAQTPTPPLSELKLRNVTCTATANAAKDGIAYDCKQSVVVAGVATISDAGSGTIVVAAPNTSQANTITVTTPSAVAGQPPDMNTMVITVSRGGNGTQGTPVLHVGIAVQTVVQ